MKTEFIISNRRDVYYHLALEEYLVRQTDFRDRKLVLIYINPFSVVLGKNQNILKEIHYQTFLEQSTPVARRISGGGTVVHDLGNINFAFFESHDVKKVNSYKTSTALLADVINQLGVKCHLNERNAIFLSNNGKKISGSAQFSCSNGILSHFTLLYQSDLTKISSILSSNSYNLQTQASASVPSLTDNLGNYLDIAMNDFIHIVLEKIRYTDTFDLHTIQEDKMNELYQKYTDKIFYYDLSNNATLSKNELSITIQSGKIETISGINNADEYIGKRLLYDEIPPDNTLWSLLH